MEQTERLNKEMKEKATIYDLWRICKYYGEKCCDCPLQGLPCAPSPENTIESIDEINETILNWRKEHPVGTRQDKFLEMFPNAYIYVDGVLQVKPCHIDEIIWCGMKSDCNICRSKYWLEEV